MKTSKKRSDRESLEANRPTLSSIPAEAALSFLKDTKGAVTWSVSDLGETLEIARREAERIIALLSAQGYVQPAHGTNEWMTTSAGESVSDAKQPRFERESVEHAAEALKEKIKQVNKDSKAAFKVTSAVAFGDFLLKDRARVQASDIGIGLVLRGTAAEDKSAYAAKAEHQFLMELRGRTALLHIRPYADWMRKRTNLELV